MNQIKSVIPFHVVNRNFLVKVPQFLVIIIATLFFSSCQKLKISHPVSDNASNTPKANAGAVLRVVYPSSTSITLSGGKSNGNAAATFKWRQIDGASGASISQPNQSATNVTNLKPGVYTFTLSTSANSGTAQVDTTVVSVLEKITWNVEGITREALVHPPANGRSAAPVIFAFHGHSGTDLGFADKGFELNWPEAIVVYPQGLPTEGLADLEGKKPGWQHTVGEVNTHTGIKDQDLKFFDAMLTTLKQKYNVNTSQVFAHGWSNGGEFVYNVLWAARGSQLAALAPAAATLDATTGRKTIPVIHTAGTKDDKVPFSEQQQSVQAVRTLDRCSSSGTIWATGRNGLSDTRYASSIKDPVVFLQYNGSHSYPYTVPPLIVKFFKEVASQSRSLSARN